MTIDHDSLIARIWKRDHTVWKPDPEEISNRLGWLDVAEQMKDRVGDLRAFADDVAADGFTRVVLLGMGGSSLAPEVLAATLGTSRLELEVLDTTHPATVARARERLDLARTLFIVASKSGTTVETMSHFAYFSDAAGGASNFVAITDPGTPLESLAREHGFRGCFLNPPDIGGRYSALSLFGLVPAALIGADLDALLDDAIAMAERCRAADGPGARLGTAMAEAALAGRDKLTIVAPPSMARLGVWIEQLIAESTGKEGRGIVPVVDEPLGDPSVYGDDRLFVAFGDARAPEGHPVVRLEDATSLGAEFFRWEFATAVAGAVLGINPFDQPDVESAKRAARAVLQQTQQPDPGYGDLAGVLASVGPRDYIALQAFLEPDPATAERLEDVRARLRDRFGVAVTTGFGPRFLHSTGQLHKGGPDSGVFLQLVDESPAPDVDIPGQPLSFGRLIHAQALGDLHALSEKGRRVCRTTLDRTLAEV